MNRFIYLCLFLLFVAPFLSASAHDVGFSLEAKVDDYFFDIGMDVPLQVGRKTLLDFTLFTEGRNSGLQKMNVEKVTVHVFSGSRIQVSESVVKPDFGKLASAVLPSESGNWTLSVAFESDANLYTHDFAVFIEPAEKKSHSAYAAPVMVIVFASFIAAYICLHRRLHQNAL